MIWKKQPIENQIASLNSKFTMTDNTGDSGEESYNISVQSDGRVQHCVNTGTINRILQYSESGIISEIKGGTTLWTTANMVKVKKLAVQISVNGNSAYTSTLPFTPDTGYTAVAVVGYNIVWNHLEVYGIALDNNGVFIALQNTSSSAMSNVSATFYVLQIKSAYV